MLERMQRVVLAAADAAAGAGWERFLDAQPAGSSRRPALGAHAHHWRLGDGWIDVLVPNGPGMVAQALDARGPHLFAGGFTVSDLGAFCRHLTTLGIAPLWDGDRLVLGEATSGIRGLRIMIEQHDPQPAVGLIDSFYELTNLVADAARESARAARVLGLDPATFQPIVSDQYGYEGCLTLFHDERLDRLEIITPNRPGTTMHRFFERRGGGLYMCFAESGELAEIERRAQEAGVGFTAVPAAGQRSAGGQRDAQGAHTVFLHPATLGGVMLGLSRRRYAWTWSGHPERVH
jgi:hypothetical protein